MKTNPIAAVALFLSAFACTVAYGMRVSAEPQEKQETVETKTAASMPASPDAKKAIGKVTKTEAEWRRILTPMAFDVLRRKGTERAFTGRYNNHKGEGLYRCAGCGLELFDSKTKFDSGTGWPSFYAPIGKANVEEKEDREYGMVRTEVLCARCGGHLGHVFDDGPKITGLRYCINSVSLRFEAGKPMEAKAAPK